MSETPGPAASPFDALVQRIVEGTAPAQVRGAAARGALPLPRPFLVRLFLVLRGDEDEAIRNDAEASLAGIGGDQVIEIVADPICPPEVLEHFAAAGARNEKIAEPIAFHPNVPDRALAVLAQEGNAAVLDLVLTNQQRLLASPGLVDRLGANPALRADQRGRVLDMLERFFAEKQSKAADAAAGTDAEQPLAIEDAAKLLEVDPGELFAASEILGGEEFEQAEDPGVRSAYKKILTLNTAQKAILAMKGGREERMILIRDTNRIVSQSVLKNPRLSELEVESIAAMRNISDEILRQVANHREWSKNYAVAVHLVRNPRCPSGIAMNFVSRLNNRDLKILSGDKNIPEIIRRMAKRTHELRNTQTQVSFRKK